MGHEPFWDKFNVLSRGLVNNALGIEDSAFPAQPTLNTLLYHSSHTSHSVCRGIGARDKFSVLSRGLVIDVVDLSLHNFQILFLIYKIMYCTVCGNTDIR